MSKTSKGGSVTGIVRNIAAPIAEGLGLTLWDVRFVKEGAEHYLRVYIDKDGGVSIDDCVNMSHALDGPLDEADPIAVGYILEVSSPGAERDLVREEHFQQYIGAPVNVRFIRPLDGKRDYKGTLEDYDNGNVTLKTEEGKTVVFQKKEASFVRLDDFDV